MAQFRSTADLLDLALINSGEVTNGNSSYETQALDFMNKVHMVLISGGTIPLGKDQTIQIDEVWPWARSKKPFILELQPKFETGSVTLTLGSEVGTFSSAPSYSVEGWFLRITGKDEVYRIASHAAASTAFELDGAYPDTSVTGGSFEVYKLDYDLVPSYIVVDSTNKHIQFQKASGTTLTGTLTAGSYTPADLISHVATVMTAAASGPTITGTYSATTRKFSLISDLAGGTAFILVGNGSLSDQSLHRDLGFDDVLSSSSGTHTSTYALGGISRLIEPLRIHKAGDTGLIASVDPEKFSREYPIKDIGEGTPYRFTVLKESASGLITIRLNAYVKDKTRLEVEHIKVPIDLKDDSTSIPLVPRKHSDVLEYATSYFICFLKSDDKMQVWADLTRGKLLAMINQHRGSMERAGENFGKTIARRDLLRKTKVGFGDPY